MGPLPAAIGISAARAGARKNGHAHFGEQHAMLVASGQHRRGSPSITYF